MTIEIPANLTPILAEADASQTSINEIDLAGRLAASFGENPQLSPEQQKGAFAEIDALRFQRPHGSERRTWGIYWSELASGTTQDGRTFYSPDVSLVDEDVLAHWISRSQTLRHPTLRARFADLAWEMGRYVRRKQKDATPSSASSISISVELAYRAIDAYLEIVSQSLFDDEFEAWQFLDRAIELAHSINDRGRCLKAKAALFQFQHSAEASNPAYILWRFDEIAWNRADALNFSDAEKQCLIDILERGLAHRASLSDKKLFDPHAAMDIADRLRRRRTQRGEKAEAQLAIKTAGAAFEEAAKGADALLASAWLEDLIPRYRNEGLNDDVARIEAAIRSRADEAAGEMKKIEVPLSIPREKLDQWAEQVAGSSPEEAFRRLAAAGLIREEAARKSAQGMLKNAPLLAHMSTSIMGADGFTRATVGSIYDDLDGRTIQHAGDLFGWYAPWVYFAFNRAKEKHGIDDDGLVRWLQKCPYFAVSREPLLRAGLSAWINKQPVEAIHILVPQVEAALRDILGSLGAVTHRPDPNTGGFRVVGMGEILNHDAFKAQAPIDIRFHFRVLYSDPRGINLRNHVAHGLAHPSFLNMGVANWVVHSILLIGALRPTNPEAKAPSFGSPSSA